MVEELLKLGVIRVSTADVPASQVLLVAKKGTTKLRFCIDFRAINEATIAPEKKPRYFGVMDLTSGYHQTPLSEASKK